MDLEKYKEIAGEQGETVRVFSPSFNNNEGGYEDVSINKFYEDRNVTENQYLLPDGTNHALADESGNIIRTRKRDEVYKYISAGYRVLDEQIVDALQTKSEDLETGRLGDKVSVGLGSLIDSFSDSASLGFNKTIKDRTRREEVETQVLKERSPITSGVGTTVGTLGGAIAPGGVAGAVGKKVVGKTGSKLLGVAAEGAAFSAPYGISKALSEKDIGKGMEEFLYGTLSVGITSGAFKVVGAGVKGVVGATRTGGNKVADTLNRDFYSFRTKKELGNFSKVQKPLLEELGTDVKSPLFKEVKESTLDNLSIKQKNRLFGTSSNISDDAFSKKSKEIFQTFSDDQVLSVNTSILSTKTKIGSGSGTTYSQIVDTLSRQTDDLSKVLDGIVKKSGESQTKVIGQNQELKKQLKKIDFVENIYGVSSDVAKGVKKNIRESSTKHIKDNLARYKNKLPENKKDFADFSEKFIYWVEKQKSKTSEVNKHTKGFLQGKQDDFYAYLKKEGFDDEEISTLYAIYDDALKSNPNGLKVAEDVFTMEGIVSKKEAMTNADALKVMEISKKYSGVKNIFNKKEFAPMKKLADDVSLAMLPKKTGLITKEEVKKEISKALKSGFNKVGSQLSSGQISTNQRRIEGAVNTMFGNKNAITIKDLGELIKGIRQSSAVFKSDVTAKSFNEKLLVSLSKYQNTKINQFASDLLKNKELSKQLSPLQISNLKNTTKLKKEISFNLNNIERISAATGADISAFLGKEVLATGALAAGAVGLAGAGAAAAITSGGVGVVLAYSAARAIKGGWGLRGMSDFSRRIAHSADNALRKFNDLGDMALFKNKITQSPSTSAASFIGITAMSDLVFGQEIDNVQDLTTLTHLAKADPFFLDSAEGSVNQLQNGYLESTNALSPELKGAQMINQQKLVNILAENLAEIGKNPFAPNAIKKFEENMSVVFDPSSITTHIKNNTVNSKMARNFKAMYPTKFQEIYEQFVLANSKGELDDLTYQQKLSLSVFLGYDFTGVRGGWNVKENYHGMQNARKEFDRKAQTAEKFETQRQKAELL